MKIPDGYPSKAIPLMSGATLNLANRNTNDKKEVSYFLQANLTNKPVKDAIEYYTNIHKTAKNQGSAVLGELHTLTGTKDGWDYIISIMPAGDNNKDVALQIVAAPENTLAEVRNNAGTNTSLSSFGSSTSVPPATRQNYLKATLLVWCPSILVL